jgi:predicted site-specific integrase-resolvase
MRHLTPGEMLVACDDDELMPVTSLAVHLGVSVKTMRSWIRVGKLPVVRVKGRWHALLTQASEVEHTTRTTRAGRPRR